MSGSLEREIAGLAIDVSTHRARGLGGSGVRSRDSRLMSRHIEREIAELTVDVRLPGA
jgi:hypothetical protein